MEFTIIPSLNTSRNAGGLSTWLGNSFQELLQSMVTFGYKADKPSLVVQKITQETKPMVKPALDQVKDWLEGQTFEALLPANEAVDERPKKITVAGSAVSKFLPNKPTLEVVCGNRRTLAYWIASAIRSVAGLPEFECNVNVLETPVTGAEREILNLRENLDQNVGLERLNDLQLLHAVEKFVATGGTAKQLAQKIAFFGHPSKGRTRQQKYFDLVWAAAISGSNILERIYAGPDEGIKFPSQSTIREILRDLDIKKPQWPKLGAEERDAKAVKLREALDNIDKIASSKVSMMSKSDVEAASSTHKCKLVRLILEAVTKSDKVIFNRLAEAEVADAIDAICVEKAVY